MSEEKEKVLAEIRKKLKELLVESLSLEGVDPEKIKDDEALFNEGLGLDSLDAVEIVVLLQRNFGLNVKDINEGMKVLYSIETLTNYVYENTKNE
jgi:acyl carrier protein